MQHQQRTQLSGVRQPGGGRALYNIMALILYALLSAERLKTKTIKITHTHTHTHTAEVRAPLPFAYISIFLQDWSSLP